MFPLSLRYLPLPFCFLLFPVSPFCPFAFFPIVVFFPSFNLLSLSLHSPPLPSLFFFFFFFTFPTFRLSGLAMHSLCILSPFLRSLPSSSRVSLTDMTSETPSSALLCRRESSPPASSSDSSRRVVPDRSLAVGLVCHISAPDSPNPQHVISLSFVNPPFICIGQFCVASTGLFRLPLIRIIECGRVVSTAKVDWPVNQSTSRS